MKVAKHVKKQKQAASAGDIMRKRGFCPVSKMVDLTEETFPVPDNPEVLKAMLWTDYEYTKDGTQLQRRARLRLDAYMELARYAHPRLKASDDSSNVNVGVIVEIKSYTDDQKPKPIVQIRQ